MAGRWRPLLLGLLALALVTPCVVLAQDDGFDLEEQEDFEVRDTTDGQAYTELTKPESEIELGFFWNSSNDKIFGNYNGFLDDGFYVLGDVDIWRRDILGWGDDYSARLRGLNLGLDSRWIGAEFGRQGRFGVFFEYDQLPAFRSETTESFFLGLGSQSLTVPTPWDPGSNGTPAEMPNLEENLRRYDIDWDRKRFTGGGSLEFTKTLGFDVRYDHETKKGAKLSAGMMGLTGGNPRSVLIPEPFDFTTQQVDAAFRYIGEDLQLSLGYYGSFFDNDVDFLQWENPYTPAGAWDPTAGFGCTDGVEIPSTAPGCGMGRKQSAPDNMFHQILASGGYDLPRSTRITLSTAFGWMLQDEDFLPYSINSALTATAQPFPTGALTTGTDLAALPRSSLDGEIFTTVVDFRVTSRPIEKLDLGLGYHFDNRENNTPRDTYVRILADSQNQATTLDTGNARINLPYSYTEHRVAADAGYRVWRRTNLKLSYEWQLTERDFQEVDELTEHTLGASLTSQPWSFLGARIRYAHAWRNGDDYVGNRPFIDGHTPIYADSEREDCEDDLAGLVNPALVLPASECPFENHPLLRKSYLANRQRDEVKLTLNLTPHEDVRFAVYLNYVNEDYDDSEIGLTNVLNWSPGFDLSYSPFERLTTHAFYSYMDFRTKQTGWSFSGGNLDHVTDPTRRWKTSDQDRTHTFGLGFNLGILPGRLDFGSDYLYAYSEGQIETSGFGSVIPYPDNRSRQHNVSVHANYRFTENITMRVGYLFAYFDQRDWALDGLDVDSLNFSGNAAVIGSGRDSEDYRANVVSWSVSYRFW